MPDEPIVLWKGRPMLEVPTSTGQRVLVIIAWIGVALSVAGTCLALQYLPETIPTHFTADGTANGYGSKMTMLMLPGVIFVLNLLFGFACRLPAYRINYPVKITLNNAEPQYRLMMTFIRVVVVLLTWMLVLLNALLIYATFHGQLNPVLSDCFVLPLGPILLVAMLVYTIKAWGLE